MGFALLIIAKKYLNRSLWLGSIKNHAHILAILFCQWKAAHVMFSGKIQQFICFSNIIIIIIYYYMPVETGCNL